MVHTGWDWPAFLSTATGLLPYAFEKSDAKEKWGGENVFAAMLGGGRSLRATAEVVLGSSAVGGLGPTDEECCLAEQLCDRMHQLLAVADGGGGEGAAEARALFGDVGGAAAWRTLVQALEPVVASAGHWG